MASSDNFPFSCLKSLRIIPFNKYEGALNMAIDSYFASQCREESSPILRFYGWDPYCLSLGYHQKKTLINFSKLERDGIHLVKRPTGGRAIFHADELTYSMVIHRSKIHHRDLYHSIHVVFKEALNALGYGVEIIKMPEPLPGLRHEAQDFPCFTKSAWTEVQFQKKKIIGSAQKILNNATLQHGSVLIGPRHKRLINYLSVDDKTHKNLTAELEKKTICLEEMKDVTITPEELVSAVIHQLEKNNNLSLNLMEITNEEMISLKNS